MWDLLLSLDLWCLLCVTVAIGKESKTPSLKKKLRKSWMKVGACSAYKELETVIVLFACLFVCLIASL